MTALHQDRHFCSWESIEHTGPDVVLWGCPECQETSGPCIVTDTARGRHPSGSSLGICARCLRVEGFILEDIEGALGWWDERDRNVSRSPAAFNLVAVRGGSRQDAGVKYPEDVEMELLGWAVRWAMSTGATEPGQGSTDYLRSRLLWAAQNPTASRWARYREEVRELRASARRIAGLAPDRMPEACAHCTGRVVQDRADERWQPLPGGLADVLRCTSCATTWSDRDAFLRDVRHTRIWSLPRSSPDAMVTLEQAAEIFPEVPRLTMKSWIYRDRRTHERSIERCDEWEARWDAWYEEGNIGPHPEPPDICERRLPERGRTRSLEDLYRLGDLHAAAARRASEGRRGRRPGRS